MKKLISVILIISLFFVFASCGTISPADVTKTFLDSIKTQDGAKFSSVYPYGGNDFSDLFSETDEGVLGEVETNAMDKMLDFDYEIKGEEINDDTAAVTVNMKCYALGAALEDAVQEMYSKIFYEYGSQLFSGEDISEEEINDFFGNILLEKINDLGDKTFEKTIKINLEKENGEWKIAAIDENSDFYETFGGGILKVIDEL